MARRQVSGGRKSAYYLGGALSIIGVLMFLSVFVTHAMNFGNFDNFQGQVQSAMFRAIGGMVLIVVGGAITNVGKRGLAGSGVLLDPEQAREDVEPWSRMEGGVMKDKLDEAGLDLGAIGAGLTAAASNRPAAGDDLPFDEKLRRLHALHQDGILTDEEYAQEKRELLDRNG